MSTKNPQRAAIKSAERELKNIDRKINSLQRLAQKMQTKLRKLRDRQKVVHEQSRVVSAKMRANLGKGPVSVYNSRRARLDKLDRLAEAIRYEIGDAMTEGQRATTQLHEAIGQRDAIAYDLRNLYVSAKP